MAGPINAASSSVYSDPATGIFSSLGLTSEDSAWRSGGGQGLRRSTCPSVSTMAAVDGPEAFIC